MAANTGLLCLQLLVLFCFVQVTTGQSPVCQERCPINLISPVCGMDNNTYMNECLLNCTPIEKRYDGVCHSAPTTPPPCMCSPIAEPVCGVDGTTYTNPCVLRCAGVEKAGDGRCPPQIITCDCSKDFKPVCGKNGKNYGNECLLNCSGVEKDYDGMCKYCHCRRTLTPVCGMDNRTYDNECFLKCAGVEKRRDGYCVCVCPLIYRPVCGVDKKKYDNDCLRQCVGVGLLKEGDCPPESYFPNARPPPVDCGNTCPCFVYLVCGVDGNTYQNLCHIECSKMKIQHIGKCTVEEERLGQDKNEETGVELTEETAGDFEINGGRARGRGGRRGGGGGHKGYKQRGGGRRGNRESFIKNMKLW